MSRKKRRQPQPPARGARVVVYIRDSHGPGQERSAAQQRAEVSKRAEAEGWVIAGWYVDSSSGTTTEGRDQFQAMLDYCHDNAKSTDAVIVWEFSRFARDEVDFAYHSSELKMLGISLVSMKDAISPGPASGMIEAAYAFAAAEESRNISRRVTRGLLSALGNGYARGGRIPVGYQAERVELGRMYDGSPRLSVRWVPDPEQAPKVKRAFEMFADGHTYAEIHEAC